MGSTPVWHSVLNVKALVGAFNQEKALVRALSVIVQPVVEPMDRFTAQIRTEKGYCAIQWKESSTTSPDPFGLDSITGAAANGAGPGSTAAPAAVACDTAYINIPTLRRLIKIHLNYNIFCLLISF